MKNIVITGGNIGTATAAILAARGYKVRVMIRKPEQNEWLEKQGVEFALADAGNPKSLQDIFDGADTFFFISPLVENMVELAKSTILAAKESGIRHIIRSSANGASAEAPIVMGRLHGEVEGLVKNSGMNYTILQPASFYQNIFGSIPSVINNGAFYGSSGNGKNAFVDVRDIAAVAASVIAESEKHFGKTYTITGPEAISNYDVAAILSSKLDSTVQYIDLPAEDLQAAYKNAGMNDFTVRALTELDAIMKLGYVANTSTDVQDITGKPPIRFEQFVTDNLNTFKV